jgi:hypothetical protein
MTGEEFGHALLATIQEEANKNNGRERYLLKPFELALRKTLGLKVQDDSIAPPIPQQLARPEFPQWRVKYDASGNELGRRRVNSLEEWAQLSRSEPGFNYALPVEE